MCASAREGATHPRDHCRRGELEQQARRFRYERRGHYGGARADLPLPDQKVVAVDVVIQIGVARGLRRGRVDGAEAELPVRQIVAIDRLDEKLERAFALGATHVFNADDPDLGAQVRAVAVLRVPPTPSTAVLPWGSAATVAGVRSVSVRVALPPAVVTVSVGPVANAGTLRRTARASSRALRTSGPRMPSVSVTGWSPRV